MNINSAILILELSLPWLVFAVSLVSLWLSIKILFRRRVLGWLGEYKVRKRLNSLGVATLHNVIIPDKLGHTEIDHLVRTGHGIIAIETKNYSGDLSGFPNEQKWKQKTQKGTYTINSPLRQHVRHELATEELIDDKTVPLRAIVVSVGKATFDRNLAAHIFSLESLHAAMKRGKANPPDPDKFEEAWQKILAHAQNRRALKKLHRRDIQKRKSRKQKVYEALGWTLLPTSALGLLWSFITLV